LSARARSLGALARALAPPAGEAVAFALLDLSQPAEADLAVEHVALFGRAGDGRLSPYEGVHRGTPMHEVLDSYAAAGFLPDPDFRDRSDHVSAQLSILAELGLDEHCANTRGDETGARAAAALARRFRLDRVEPWVPEFFAAMAAADEFASYRALGECGARLIRRETARIDSGEPEQSEAAPMCERCGGPIGVVPPRKKVLFQTWSLVCVRCRVQDDLRRQET